MRKAFLPLVVITAAVFAYAPIMIAQAPLESTMLMVQKIFYFHLPSWIVMFSAIGICGAASAWYLIKGTPQADRLAVACAEIAALFGLFGLVTGSFWGRKAWGVWWQWDARLTTALLLELILFAYLILRRYGGPGSEKLAAGVALFGMADSVIVYYSVQWWRTIHPTQDVMRTLGEKAPAMLVTQRYCIVAFLLLFATLLIARIGLENRRAELDELYLAEEI
jgi:heme exporter protein C